MIWLAIPRITKLKEKSSSKMLSNREKERAEARVSWHAIEKLKI